MGGLLVLAGAIFTGKVDTAGADLGAALAYAFAGIVLGYIGGAVVDDVKKRLDEKTR
jgi:sorbitol-specific phosphotransferase system component IIC